MMLSVPRVGNNKGRVIRPHDGHFHIPAHKDLEEQSHFPFCHNNLMGHDVAEAYGWLVDTPCIVSSVATGWPEQVSKPIFV